MSTPPVSRFELSEREEQIAALAARLAVKQITDDFYKDVGKTVVTKFFIIVGGLTVAFLAGKYNFDLSKIFTLGK